MSRIGNHELPIGGAAPATLGFNAVAPEWLISYGAADAAPAIPAAESTLGSHPCVALSSAQVLPEWINRNFAANAFAPDGDYPLNFVSHSRGSLQPPRTRETIIAREGAFKQRMSEGAQEQGSEPPVTACKQPAQGQGERGTQRPRNSEGSAPAAEWENTTDATRSKDGWRLVSTCVLSEKSRPCTHYRDF